MLIGLSIVYLKGPLMLPRDQDGARGSGAVSAPPSGSGSAGPARACRRRGSPLPRSCRVPVAPSARRVEVAGVVGCARDESAVAAVEPATWTTRASLPSLKHPGDPVLAMAIIRAENQPEPARLIGGYEG